MPTQRQHNNSARHPTWIVAYILAVDHRGSELAQVRIARLKLSEARSLSGVIVSHLVGDIPVPNGMRLVGCSLPRRRARNGARNDTRRYRKPPRKPALSTINRRLTRRHAARRGRRSAANRGRSDARRRSAILIG